MGSVRTLVIENDCVSITRQVLSICSVTRRWNQEASRKKRERVWRTKA